MPRKSIIRKRDPFVYPFLYSMLLWLGTLITSFVMLFYSTLSQDVIFEYNINIALKIFIIVSIAYCPLYLLGVVIIVLTPKNSRRKYIIYFTYIALLFSIYLLRNIRYMATKSNITELANKFQPIISDLTVEDIANKLEFAYKNLDSCTKANMFLHILFSIPFNYFIIKDRFFKPKVDTNRRKRKMI